MANKELKDRIKLIRSLKEARDEASAIQKDIAELHTKVGNIFDRVNGLIKQVEELDKEAKKEVKTE